MKAKRKSKKQKILKLEHIENGIIDNLIILNIFHQSKFCLHYKRITRNRHYYHDDEHSAHPHGKGSIKDRDSSDREKVEWKKISFSKKRRKKFQNITSRFW